MKRFEVYLGAKISDTMVSDNSYGFSCFERGAQVFGVGQFNHEPELLTREVLLEQRSF